jgi:hypothetical protein
VQGGFLSVLPTCLEWCNEVSAVGKRVLKKAISARVEKLNKSRVE